MSSRSGKVSYIAAMRVYFLPFLPLHRVADAANDQRTHAWLPPAGVDDDDSTEQLSSVHWAALASGKGAVAPRFGCS